MRIALIGLGAIGKEFVQYLGASNAGVEILAGVIRIRKLFTRWLGDSSGEHADVLQSPELIILYAAIVMHFVQLRFS